jgi:S-adenosylmethionine-diacylglycerol 3-amino-3-carboxypropyl transferase
VFWDERLSAIEEGVVHCGRLEAYFQTFRRRVLPLVHGRSKVAALLAPRDRAERQRFYEESWDGWRWRALFRLFFSRRIMGWLGRDPELFRYVHGPVAEKILDRARHGLAVLPTHDNPYLHYILTGRFGKALPDYLRPESHAPIQKRLSRLTLRLGAADETAAQLPDRSIDAFNLSDIAEYTDLSAYHRLLEGLRRIAAPGARLAYWNLLAPRRRPQSMAQWLEAARVKAARLHAEAQTFFYQALVVEVAR